MDIKLRSLICLGLNEQAIHLWLESLASNEEVVKKYYQPSSFLGSPGWVQVIYFIINYFYQNEDYEKLSF